jgi:hypothetical protein
MKIVKETKFVKWRFTAKWASRTYSGEQWFSGEPDERDTEYIQYDLLDMLGELPDDLEINWERA